jgi:hypothetical protein
MRSDKELPLDSCPGKWPFTAGEVGKAHVHWMPFQDETIESDQIEVKSIIIDLFWVEA